MNQVLCAASPAPSSPLACERAAIQNDRARAEMRHGRSLAILDPAPGAPLLLVSAVETQGADQFPWILSLADTNRVQPRLLLTAERLRVLGFKQASTPRAMRIARPLTSERLQLLAAAHHGVANGSLLDDPHMASASMQAAIRLAKQARLIPALLTLTLPRERLPALQAAQILTWDLATDAAAPVSEIPRLERVSEAGVPIDAQENCQLVLFREVDSHVEHVVMMFGATLPDPPVPVRMHSSCLTGDLFRSLRCDCGDQLEQAMGYLAQVGGVLLYLSQEGRGTGLANKLRAYRLQDGGLDTIEADQHLGFRGDERDFPVAAAMLRALGIYRITLLTNNPGKIEALRNGGIEVVGRQQLTAPVNRHNMRYIQTKRERSGHFHCGEELP